MVFKRAREMQEEMNVKVYADYPKDISERRKQQWPRMKKAREEGKTAFFLNLNPTNNLLTDILCLGRLITYFFGQLLYVQFVVPDICMLLNILILISYSKKNM